MSSPRHPPSQPVPMYRLPPREGPPPAARVDDCVIALKALGEDTRVRIVSLLIDTPLDVTELSDRVGVSQYNVSKHLRILREAGLLEVEKHGRRHLYALPAHIRRRAAAGRVLDLGCCSFRFERGSHGETATASPAGRPKRRSR